MTNEPSPLFSGRRILLFLCAIYGIQMGFALYSRAILYPYMQMELDWTRGQIMLGHTASGMLFGFASPVTAWVINRYGAKNAISAGSLIVVGANLMIGLFGHLYPVYLAMSFLNGLGLCLSTVLATQTVAIAWFKLRRAFALGVVLGGGSIGGFLFPQIVNYAVEVTGGFWRLGWVICAAAALAAFFLNLSQIRNRPADIGQHPDGIDPALTPATSGQRVGIYRSEVNWSLGDALRTPALWLIILASTGNVFLWEIMLSQGPFHLQDRGFAPALAAFYYSMAIGTSIIGRFGLATIGDRFETRYLFAGGISCIFLGGVLFWFASPEIMWITYLYPILAGIGFGTAFVCRSLFVSNYFGSGSFATISGVVAPISSLVTAFAPPMAGYYYDLHGTYLVPIAIACIGAIIGLLASLLSKPPQPARSGPVPSGGQG